MSSARTVFERATQTAKLMHQKLTVGLPETTVQGLWFESRRPSFLETASSVLREVKKYVTIRNEIIHRGRDVSFELLDEAIDLVEDLLLMLDYLDGETWAWVFIGDKVRAPLTPPPRNRT